MVGIALSQLGCIFEINGHVDISQAWVTVEPVHPPVSWHVLESSHESVLVDTGIAATTSLTCATAGLLATAVITAASSELICSRYHRNPSNHPSSQVGDCLSTEAKCPPYSEATLDSAPALRATWRM